MDDLIKIVKEDVNGQEKLASHLDEIIDFERPDLKEFLVKAGINEEKLLELVSPDE